MKLEDEFPADAMRVTHFEKVDIYFDAKFTVSGRKPIMQKWITGFDFHVLPSARELVVPYGDMPSQIVKLKISGGFIQIPDTPLGQIIFDFRHIRSYYADKGTFQPKLHQVPFLKEFGIQKPVSGEISFFFKHKGGKEFAELLKIPEIAPTLIKEERCGYCGSLKTVENISQQRVCAYCLPAICALLRTTRILLNQRKQGTTKYDDIIMQGAVFLNTLRELSAVLIPELVTECTHLQMEVLQEFPQAQSQFGQRDLLNVDSVQLNRVLEYANLLLLDNPQMADKMIPFHGGNVLYPEGLILAELAVLGKCEIRDLEKIEKYEILNGFLTKNNQVEELKFNETGLTYLPEDIQKLTHLQILALESLQAQTLPDWLGDLRLKGLNINFTRFREFPPILTRLKTLEELDMSTTPMPLPDNFGELIGLKRFACGYKRLPILPDSIGQLTHLNFLFLHGSTVSQLTPAFANLQELEEVWLTNNNLTSLPDFLVKLKKLKTLYLQGNPLCEHPDKNTQAVIKQLEKQGTHVILRNKK